MNDLEIVQVFIITQIICKNSCNYNKGIVFFMLIIACEEQKCCNSFHLNNIVKRNFNKQNLNVSNYELGLEDNYLQDKFRGKNNEKQDYIDIEHFKEESNLNKKGSKSLDTTKINNYIDIDYFQEVKELGKINYKNKGNKKEIDKSLTSKKIQADNANVQINTENKINKYVDIDYFQRGKDLQKENYKKVNKEKVHEKDNEVLRKRLEYFKKQKESEYDALKNSITEEHILEEKCTLENMHKNIKVEDNLRQVVKSKNGKKTILGLYKVDNEEIINNKRFYKKTFYKERNNIENFDKQKLNKEINEKENKSLNDIKEKEDKVKDKKNIVLAPVKLGSCTIEELFSGIIEFKGKIISIENIKNDITLKGITIMKSKIDESKATLIYDGYIKTQIEYLKPKKISNSNIEAKSEIYITFVNFSGQQDIILNEGIKLINNIEKKIKASIKEYKFSTNDKLIDKVNRKDFAEKDKLKDHVEAINKKNKNICDKEETRFDLYKKCKLNIVCKCTVDILKENLVEITN